MIDINTINKTEKLYKIHFFLKFTEEKSYAEDILNGKLHLNTPEFFQALETEHGKRGQGNKNECKLNANLGNGYLIKGGKQIEEDINNNNFCYSKIGNEYDLITKCKDTHLIYQDKDDLKVSLLCFTGFTIKQLNVVYSDNDKICFKIPFTDEQLNKMITDFGSYCAIIDAKEINEKIHRFANINKIKLRNGVVKYRDDNSKDRIKSFSENKHDRFFYSDKDLPYQSEYRYVFDMNLPKDHFINIGPLKYGSILSEPKDLKNITYVLKR